MLLSVPALSPEPMSQQRVRDLCGGAWSAIASAVERQRRSPLALPLGARALLRTQALVLSWVAGVVVCRYLLGATDTSATFLAYPAVVALAAWRGGWLSGLVATLGSVAAVLLLDAPTSASIGVFAFEGVSITAVVTALAAQLNERVATLDHANRQIGRLQAAEQRSRSLDVSVRALETLTPDCAIVLLDRQGAIAEWRESAERLYGLSPDAMRGRPLAILFPEGEAAPDAGSLLTEAGRGVAIRRFVGQRRGDGATFDAEVEIAKTTGAGGDGFALVVHDLTVEHERQRTSSAAADAQRALRDEADLAQRQLAALQSITDPSLNEWPTSELLDELLERLRQAVQADGIALIATGGGRALVRAAIGGLQPNGPARAGLPDLGGRATSRVVLVHNDETRLAEQSLLAWPAGTTSLISVPIVQDGHVEGAIEVVDRRSRRSTEWEMALVQVVAARMAGVSHDRHHARTVVA